MIKHLVLFKLKDEQEHLKEELFEKANELYMDIFLKKEVGKNIGPSARAYDVSLSIEFTEIGDLEKYDVFPQHLKFKDYVRNICKDISVIDYEV